MRRLLMLLVAILASLLIAGCGTSGHSADAPASGMTLVPGDGIITASWAMDPSVEYWLFFGASSSITTSNWATIADSVSVIDAKSPYIAGGLSNGTVYSFTVNGRTNGGPGGPGTPSVSATPRLAGTAPAPWTAGTALGTKNLRGVMWGTTLVAVGDAGVMYSSPDGVTWTALTSPVTSNLNAAQFDGVYLAAGDGGVILYSTDATTWTPQVSTTASNLYGLGSVRNFVVAVGAGGTIISSADGINWTAAASSGKVTANDLYAVTAFRNGLITTWVTVGAKGTVLTSPDANTWTAVTSNTALDLKGVTFGTNAAARSGVFVAVGANGTLLTSLDTKTWTVQPAIGTNTLSAISYGTQFIAVGAKGTIYTSTDGTTWAAQPVPAPATGSDLNAIVHATYSYSVVGAAGVNLLAK